MFLSFYIISARTSLSLGIKSILITLLSFQSLMMILTTSKILTPSKLKWIRVKFYWLYLAMSHFTSYSTELELKSKLSKSRLFIIRTQYLKISTGEE